MLRILGGAGNKLPAAYKLLNRIMAFCKIFALNDER